MTQDAAAIIENCQDEAALRRLLMGVLRKSPDCRKDIIDRHQLAEARATEDDIQRLKAEQYNERQTQIEEVDDSLDDSDFYEKAKFVPMRLTYDERKYLRLIDATMHVSQYTDHMDVMHKGNPARKMALQMKQMCAILSGMMVAHNYEEGQQLMQEREYSGKSGFFQSVLEIGRRYKILNPERMRDSYGKLLYMLQDSRKPDVRELLEFDCVMRVRTVYDVLSKSARGLEMLKDQQLKIATMEIMPEGKSRPQIQREIKAKEAAIKSLSRNYCAVARQNRRNTGGMFRGFGYSMGLVRSSYQDSDSDEDLKESENLTQDEVEQCIYSLGDHSTYIRFNREPCDCLIRYLKNEFDPKVAGSEETSLAIAEGIQGARLNHSHERQYNFVLQSMTLWREVLDNMFQLWHLAEEDLLDEQCAYNLTDTGQGLHRVQSSPRSVAAMRKILERVQRKVGGWVGSDTIHLGDHNVANALMFIDKYIQVPRILGPLVLCLDKIQDLYASNSGLRAYIDSWGGVQKTRRIILADFFRHAFDGSGADNFFDAGSCIDGRLTSAWNWCSVIEAKPYFPIFLLTGFTGFDGKEGW